ncbi:MAG: response regulator [Acidobacteriia bacterium]|nr:response regulator [Terriglobia bacterium]
MGKLSSRWPAIAVVLIAAQAAVAFALPPSFARSAYTIVCYFFLSCLATTAAVLNARRSARGSRTFWSFLAASYGLLTLLNWLWVYSVLLLRRETAVGWLHESVFFLQGVPLMAAAITYPHWKQSPQSLYRATLNLILLLFFWVFLFAYFVFSYRFVEPSVYYQRYEALYFAENLFLLVVLGVLVVRSQPPWATLYWHLFGAACLWTISVQMQNIAFSYEQYRPGGWFDIPAVASCCWLVWVPLLGMKIAPQLVESPGPTPASRKPLSLLAFGVLLAIPLLGAWEVGHEGNSSEMHRFRMLAALVSFALVALAVFAKEQLASREALDTVSSDLRLAEERFHKAFDSSPEGITITSPSDGRYIEVNDAYLRMIGYTRSELLGRTALELDVWADPAVRARVVDELQQKQSLRGVPATFRAKSGQAREVEISLELIQLEGETCMLSITRDVTQHRLLEQQFRQAQKMEAVGQLAGGVAHDFNNLLAVILGCSDLLAKYEGADPVVSKRLKVIRSACERGAALTSQLLAFSRRQILQPRVLDLNTIVSDTAKMLERVLGEDIEQELILEPTLGRVKVDPGQMAQVIINLAVNARDAMPQGGRLTLQTANMAFEESTLHPGVLLSPGPYVILSVRDTGVGMDEETRAHVFDPFFTTKPAGEGTGLGLATVLGIVEQSGGYIFVCSEPGQGTTFAVYLPSVDEPVESTTLGMPAADVTRGSETVLLVEDDRALRDLVRGFLQEAGYTVLPAPNGVDALRVAEQHVGTIDLLLTDVIMPQLNGPELAQALAQSRPATQVLYMSGYTYDKIRHTAIGAGVNIIQKPFRLEELAQKMRQLLGRPGGSGSEGGASGPDRRISESTSR